MRKNVFGRRLKRDKNERKALFKGLMSSLAIYGRITTTKAKAKAIKGQVDKLVGIAKKYKKAAVPHLSLYLSAVAVGKIIDYVAPRFVDRQGGYTRILQSGRRLSDNSETVVMEWIDYQEVEKVKEKARIEKIESLKKKQKVEKVKEKKKEETKEK